MNNRNKCTIPSTYKLLPSHIRPSASNIVGRSQPSSKEDVRWNTKIPCFPAPPTRMSPMRPMSLTQRMLPRPLMSHRRQNTPMRRHIITFRIVMADIRQLVSFWCCSSCSSSFPAHVSASDTRAQNSHLPPRQANGCVFLSGVPRVRAEIDLPQGNIILIP